MTGPGNRLERAIERAFAPVPVRVGVVVTSCGAPVGNIVVDERKLHGAACRGCDWCAYDVRSVAVISRGLVGHLVADHDLDAQTLDVGTAEILRTRKLGSDRFRFARTIENVIRSGRRQGVRGAA